MRLLFIFLISIPLVSFADSPGSTISSESSCTCSGPSGYAAIGVMGEHMHDEGESMFSYRFMNMSMSGNRNGTTNLTTQEVLNDFMVAPEDMDMQMHMLGFMHALSDDLTVMAMLPISEISMNHVTRNGMRFKTRSSGIGDAKLSALVKTYEDDIHHFHFNAGLSLPTGDIDVTDATPMGLNTPLPYPMQLGSGTYDLMPGFTYTGKSDGYFWGAQAIGTIRLGDNDNDYSLGDRLDATMWITKNVTQWVSTSVRTAWSSWGNIDGSDKRLNPMMVPTARTDLRGGEKLDLGLGITVNIPETEYRLSAEYLHPAYQNLDGPQLKSDGTWIFGFRGSF